MEGAETVFESGSSKKATTDEPSSAELYEQIGRLKIELDWAKQSGRERLKSAAVGSRLAIVA